MLLARAALLVLAERLLLVEPIAALAWLATAVPVEANELANWEVKPERAEVKPAVYCAAIPE